MVVNEEVLYRWNVVSRLLGEVLVDFIMVKLLFDIEMFVFVLDFFFYGFFFCYL